MNSDTQPWMCNFLAGRIGSTDPLVRGTEIVHIEAHKGRLYAGNGYWMIILIPDTLGGFGD